MLDKNDKRIKENEERKKNRMENRRIFTINKRAYK